MGTFQKYSACAQWVLGGQIASELTMNSPCTHWVNAPLPPVLAQCIRISSDVVRPFLLPPCASYHDILPLSTSYLFPSTRQRLPSDSVIVYLIPNSATLSKDTNDVDSLHAVIGCLTYVAEVFCSLDPCPSLILDTGGRPPFTQGVN